jgi:SAM-dependent MidA family methyltransferase
MTFPALTADEAAHCGQVRAVVDAAIDAAGGWIPFSQYQQLVLYAPGLGYYAAGAAKFGAGGDFVTAPEISPLFGRALARWIAPLLSACGQGAGLLELGAGSGALARQLLAELADLGIRTVPYRILEVSAELRERQMRELAGLPVQWLDRLPDGFRGVVIGNEVLDALVCERFVQGPQGLLACGVARDAGDRLVAATRPVGDVGDVLGGAYRAFEAALATNALVLPPGYAGEFIPALAPFVRTLADTLTQGALLLIDYGLPRRQLYLPERGAGTLRCIRRHHAHDDPFRDPGLTDITCWVDFTTVAEAALASDLELRAFASQMGWLLECGLEDLLGEALQSAATESARQQIIQGVRTLLLPGEMGEAVKMMCLTRRLPPELGKVVRQDFRKGL